MRKTNTKEAKDRIRKMSYKRELLQINSALERRSTYDFGTTLGNTRTTRQIENSLKDNIKLLTRVGREGSR